MDDFILDAKLKPQKSIRTMSRKEFKKYWNDRADIYKQREEIKKIEGEIKMSKENGIYVKKKTEKTPKWIICQFGLKISELKPNENGYVNIDICTSQDGSYVYPKINDWTPNKKEENIVTFKNDEEIPF